ncbi:uncharacterized protein [Euphorbia lathyris]|uniref:uncharacterized protein n=1 Tax=Euphorbia lathyris TaxID=212925 RepID=UPI0033136C7F
MDSRKRLRDDSLDSQLAGVDFSVQSENSVDLDVVKPDNNDSGIQSNDSSGDLPEAKRIHVDFFSILDDSDEPAIQGLDSVIRSFEEEILVSLSGPPSVETEVASVGEGSHPDLGYLFEASDDELGLPPTFSGEIEKVAGEYVTAETSGSDAAGVGGILGFEDQIASYDSFDFGLPDGPVSHSYNDTGDFVTLGGLFNYTDDNYVAADISGVQWQPESLSAL